jgi:hypothetical protein
MHSWVIVGWICKPKEAELHLGRESSLKILRQGLALGIATRVSERAQTMVQLLAREGVTELLILCNPTLIVNNHVLKSPASDPLAKGDWQQQSGQNPSWTWISEWLSIIKPMSRSVPRAKGREAAETRTANPIFS